jgi:hypothetical protein
MFLVELYPTVYGLQTIRIIFAYFPTFLVSFVKLNIFHLETIYYLFCLFLQTVTYVPHVTDAIIDWVERVAKIPVDGTQQTPHVCIVEVFSKIKFHIIHFSN